MVGLLKEVAQRVGGASGGSGPAVEVGVDRGYGHTEDIIGMVSEGVHTLGVINTSSKKYHPLGAWKAGADSPHDKPMVVPCDVIHGYATTSLRVGILASHVYWRCHRTAAVPLGRRYGKMQSLAYVSQIDVGGSPVVVVACGLRDRAPSSD